jgi:hypothetical protein
VGVELEELELLAQKTADIKKLRRQARNAGPFDKEKLVIERKEKP